MKQKLKSLSYWFSIIIIGIIVGISLQFATAWVAPSGTPPTGNVGAPINTSDSLQEKIGPFITKGFRNKNATVLDGTVGIGVPYTGTPPVAQISAGLNLDVEGKVGATEYCDQNGNNCKTISEISNSVGDFGGFYMGIGAMSESGCGTVNPKTRRCSCPLGYTSYLTGFSYMGGTPYYWYHICQR